MRIVITLEGIPMSGFLLGLTLGKQPMFFAGEEGRIGYFYGLSLYLLTLNLRIGVQLDEYEQQ